MATTNKTVKYKKVAIKRELKEKVSAEEVKAIADITAGYGNLQILADTAQVSSESIRIMLNTGMSTKSFLDKLKGAVEFIANEQEVSSV